MGPERNPIREVRISPMTLSFTLLGEPRRLSQLPFARGSAHAPIQCQVVVLVDRGIRPSPFVPEIDAMIGTSRRCLDPHFQQSRGWHLIPKVKGTGVLDVSVVIVTCIGILKVIDISD